MRRARRGIALLEVLVAVAILASAALSVVALLAQMSDFERRAEATETRLGDEERLLTALTLLTRDDLDRRLGQRTAGPYVVEIQRPDRVLYRLAIGTSDAPSHPDLATLVYRPEAARDGP
jgi:type II secretory pathway component PulJ